MGARETAVQVLCHQVKWHLSITEKSGQLHACRGSAKGINPADAFTLHTQGKLIYYSQCLKKKLITYREAR